MKRGVIIVVIICSKVGIEILDTKNFGIETGIESPILNKF